MVNSTLVAEQVYDVVAYDSAGECLGVVNSGVTITGAIAFCRAYNVNRDGRVAMPIQIEEHQTALCELEAADFCQRREDETGYQHTLWDWLQLGCDVEAIDTAELDSECHYMVVDYLTSVGHELGQDANDTARLCDFVPVAIQLAIWNELRQQF